MAGVASLVKAYLSITDTAGSSLLATVGNAAGGAVGGAVGQAANAAVYSEGLGTLTFKFNPRDYTVSKSASWRGDAKASPGANAPEAQFLGAEPQMLRIEIFLDESDSRTGDVSKDVDVLMRCCTVVKDSNPPRPPTVVFGWGTHTSFNAYVEKVEAHFTMFRPDGTPYRATCSVTLRELPTTPAPTNPSSGTPVIHRTRTVVAGDTLASVAYAEYRNPSYWRAIAEANAIDDPMRVPTGTVLLLPPPRQAAALS